MLPLLLIFEVAKKTPARTPANLHAEIWAGVLTILIFVVVAAFRRFAAARFAGNTFIGAFWFAFGGKTANDVSKFHGIIVGQDNRTSTSKTMAFLWTLVLVFILITLTLIWASNPTQFAIIIGQIDLLYLVLLGGPFAAAVLAKSIVSSVNPPGQPQKPKADKPSISDIFSADDGSTDLVDTQYLLFNLFAAAVVLYQFWMNPAIGAPHIPAFLAILTGGSAAAYVGNKAANTTAAPSPKIDRVVPPVAAPGSEITLLGSAFTQQGDKENPQVIVGGYLAAVVDTPSDTQISVCVNADTPADSRDVVIRTADGIESKTFYLPKSKEVKVVAQNVAESK